MQGLGAQISHILPGGAEKPIAHASRSLTPAEKNYSQIEKEALSLVFAVTKFHRMIYGRKFLLRTDHKPLLSIFGSKKGIPVHSASRLQRWALTLMTYDFDIEYVKTENFGNVDTLSRLLPVAQPQDEDYVIACATMEYSIKSIVRDTINLLPVTHHMIQSATLKDDILQQVIHKVQKSWPRKAKDLKNRELLPHFNRKSQLTIVDGCLLSGERVVIPFIYRNRILQTLHKGHQGQERMKAIARSTVYWPNIDQDIIEYQRRCSKCQMHAKSPVKANLYSWPNSTRPMQRVHIDIAGPIRSFYYLVIVDSYSKWPEAYQCTSITARKMVDIMLDFCNRFGYPETLISDNGTQFTSSEFIEFCKQHGIQQIRTAPYHPQSNGQAERYVDTIKTALNKCHNENVKDNNSLQEFLLQYRSTPNASCPEGKSPAELFIGRKLRTEIELLKPKESSSQRERNTKMENQFNKKHGTKHREFKVNEKVYVKVFKNSKMQWYPGIIKKKLGEVNYNVEVIDDKRYRTIKSHVNQLLDRKTEDKDFSSINLQPLFSEETNKFSVNSPNHCQNEALDHQGFETNEQSNSSDDDNSIETCQPTEATERRPNRVRRPPAWLQDYVQH